MTRPQIYRSVPEHARINEHLFDFVGLEQVLSENSEQSTLAETQIVKQFLIVFQFQLPAWDTDRLVGRLWFGKYAKQTNQISR